MPGLFEGMRLMNFNLYVLKLHCSLYLNCIASDGLCFVRVAGIKLGGCNLLFESEEHFIISSLVTFVSEFAVLIQPRTYNMNGNLSLCTRGRRAFLLDATLLVTKD